MVFLSLIKKNWKVALAIIVAGLLYISASWYISSIKTESYNNGRNEVEEEYKARIAAENEKNREFEKTLQGIIEDFGTKAVEKALVRKEATIIHQEKIREIIRNNPVYESCNVDQEVLNERNNIRALGPTGAETSIRRSDGSVRVEFNK